ncbi:MAG: phosphodiesterase [Tissierellia bacterium]|nr:phosphodiesterase [Tissierellia bacterium]
MKIGIISDTHGGLMDFSRAVEYLSECEKIIHLGDVLNHGPRNGLPPYYDPKTIAAGLSKTNKFIYIQGNCDSEVDEMVTGKNIHEKERLIEVDGFRIYAVHGHKGSEEERIKKAKELKADILLYGHTHIKKLEKIDGVLVCNPGSTTFPKDGSKSIAFYEDGVLNLVDLEQNEIIISEEL